MEMLLKQAKLFHIYNSVNVHYFIEFSSLGLSFLNKNAHFVSITQPSAGGVHEGYKKYFPVEDKPQTQDLLLEGNSFLTKRDASLYNIIVLPLYYIEQDKYVTI